MKDHSHSPTLLWLDDIRNPLEFSTLPNVKTIWVKNYDEFVDFIKFNGLPDAMSLDHDLGEGSTGYDCMKWVIEYCLDNEKKLPIFINVHSANPVGAENIKKLIDNFIKFLHGK